MAEKQGLDYFLASDAWKDDQNHDWNKIDYYVHKGYLTPHDRDLLHAQGSMNVLNPSGGGFPEVDAAESKYQDVNDKHGDDPIFSKDTSADKIPGADFDQNPQDGVDYGSKPPPGVAGVVDAPKVPDVPDVPGGGGDNAGGGQGKISVNTQALKKFAENIDSLRQMIADAAKQTDQVDVKPGGFNAAYQLRDKINGSGDKTPGLRNDVRLYMDKTNKTLEHIRDEVRKMVADYDKSEDLNKLNADKLNQIMNESFSAIDQSSSSQQG